MASMFTGEVKMISDENAIKMADQLQQCINALTELTNVVGVLLERIEKLEKETKTIPTLN